MKSRDILYESLGSLDFIGRLLFKTKIRVLAYHKVENSHAFEEQLKYLKKIYNLISIDDLFKSFHNHSVLKANSVLLTFDDGDVSFYRNGFPLLQKYNIPAVLFIITDLIGSNKPFWWEELEYYLGKVEGNKLAWRLKDVKNNEREEVLVRVRIESNLPELKVNQLDVAEIKEMQSSVISCGNHSHTHPMFNQCNSEELEYELKNSIDFLNLNNLSPYYFAYPNGNWDINSEKHLKSNKIKLSFLFDHKLADFKNPLRISRIRVDSTLPISEFKAKVSGLHSILYHKTI